MVTKYKEILTSVSLFETKLSTSITKNLLNQTGQS